MVGVYSPGINTPRSTFGFEPHPIIGEAWEALRRSIVNFRDQPVGTIAAIDNSAEELNYDQVFVRDFVPSALAFLMNGEPDIVKNFLLKTLRLQSREKKIDQFKLGDGVMPASFKVSHDPVRNYETITADFGESAIGRVAPVDSGFWWIILLRAYPKSTGDTSLATPEQASAIMEWISAGNLLSPAMEGHEWRIVTGCDPKNTSLVRLLHKNKQLHQI